MGVPPQRRTVLQSPWVGQIGALQWRSRLTVKRPISPCANPLPLVPPASRRVRRTAGPGQTIGLLGGSFNPPHVAHRLISEVALKRLGLDKVWWVVSPGNPLKKRNETAPLAERLRLCRAIATNPHIVVTDFEADLPSPYTASTLAFLKARSPLVRFVWIMGADNLATFDRWQRWREIFTMVPVVVVDRPGWRLKALASKPARAFAASRLPETEAGNPRHAAGAGLDLPDRPAVARVLHGHPQPGKGKTARRGQKGTFPRRPALEEGQDHAGAGNAAPQPAPEALPESIAAQGS